MPHKLLCVEDYEPTRAVMSAALRQYSPAFAADGREALTRLNAETFDAFVLDLWLPDYTGIPLCREIRDIDPHVPIIFWTIADGVDLRARALRAGATAYLRKTEEYEPLRDKLRELIGEADERCSLAFSAAGATLAEIKARYSATDS